MSNKIAWVELETPTGDRVTASVFDIECIERECEITWVGFRSGRMIAVAGSREQVKEKIEQCLSK